ncbi:LOW QUALITY PROTEIN: wall-associated receptor kinase-like 20 [Coffea eugenioides]|uniref:LOW QUALITY PROTEIN: wall-associated receptor kinase-like 20 n=1 Tax=Coffea eugenioides TaxID=49369 RepID=UPI000F6104EC|nr:LOW QUALITY PROTEIN: wall-associated receptor kinase-like 20 [Coffea eugenioides]
MEGLIPLVYRAIMQYKNGQQAMMGSWMNESPSASYMRLPGDSGRFQMPDIQLFRPDCAFPASASSPSSSATKRMLSAAVQSPGLKEREEILNAKSNGKSAKIFTGKEIKRATNNFSKDNLLGYGGFGEVFRGTLDDGTIAAVKRAKPGNMKGIVQLLNEVRILCQVNHRSLVRLLGCCVELEQPLLVYEYVPNGTLFDRLHGFRLHNWAPLNWLRRLIIAYQTADGLAYLHSSGIPPIYHRDVQSSNILLDERLDAKVTDFGLSRLVESNESEYTHINTSAQGTLGYLDPEYCINLQLTDRSDVYSFGVVLLELSTSKRVIDFNREEENVNLVVYVKKILGEDKLMDTIDPTLKEWASKVELETMQAVANLAAACLDERRQNRPSMREVAEEIEYVMGILDANDSKAEQFTCRSPSQNSFLGLLWSFLVLCVL